MRKIKCPNCGTFNTNKDYCSNCGTLINFKIRRELERQKSEKRRQQYHQEDKKTRFSLVEKYKNHRFFVVRIFGYLLYYVWSAVMAIGAFIAWLFAMTAA